MTNPTPPAEAPRLFVPVNASSAAIHAADTQSASSDADPISAPQRDGSDLHAADLALWEQESYELSGSLAASVGFPLWTSHTNDTVKIMLFGTSRYVDVHDGAYDYRYGVAIRALLEITDTENQAKATLPAIAAQAQLGTVQASCQLLVSGYTGNISAALPQWTTFDVGSYADYMSTVSGLQKDVFGDDAHITPVLLGTTGATSLTDRHGLPRRGLRNHLRHLHV